MYAPVNDPAITAAVFTELRTVTAAVVGFTPVTMLEDPDVFETLTVIAQFDVLSDAETDTSVR